LLGRGETETERPDRGRKGKRGNRERERQREGILREGEKTGDVTESGFLRTTYVKYDWSIRKSNPPCWKIHVPLLENPL